MCEKNDRLSDYRKNEPDEWIFDYKSDVYGYPFRCPKCGALSEDAYDKCEDCGEKLIW